MDGILLVSRLTLSVVFVIAGILKLSDLPGSRKAMKDFGIPVTLSGHLGTLLPLIELLIGLTLIPHTTAWWSAVAALFLICAFITAVSVNLALDRRPQCHCFGQLHSTPIGWTTLMRNAVLLALAAIVAWYGYNNPGPSVWAATQRFTVEQTFALMLAVTLLGAVATAAWLLVQVLRQNGRLLLRVEAIEKRLKGSIPTTEELGESHPGLPLTALAPTFALPMASNGTMMSLQQLLRDRLPVMLVFISPICGPCKTLLPDIARWQREYSSSLTVALISQGTQKANQAKVVKFGLTNVLLQQANEVAEAYQCYGTPGAVLVHPDGTIGSPVKMGGGAIKELFRRSINAPLSKDEGSNGSTNGEPDPMRLQPSLKIGDPAPPLRLRDVRGRDFSLDDWKGHSGVLLFWNPRCGYCTQMLPSLKAVENHSFKDGSRILIVSTGTVEENNAMGLRSPIVLDPDFAAGHTYNVPGTPSAVLIDVENRIASGVAVGATAVLDLIGLGSRELERAMT